MLLRLSFLSSLVLWFLILCRWFFILGFFILLLLMSFHFPFLLLIVLYFVGLAVFVLRLMVFSLFSLLIYNLDEAETNFLLDFSFCFLNLLYTTMNTGVLLLVSFVKCLIFCGFSRSHIEVYGLSLFPLFFSSPYLSGFGWNCGCNLWRVVGLPVLRLSFMGFFDFWLLGFGGSCGSGTCELLE